MSNENWSEFSGEDSYRRPPSIQADSIRMDGEKGFFKHVFKEGDKYENKAITKPPKKDETTGETLEVIFLRVRRRLTDFSGGFTSSEHNTPNDKIVLFGKGGERVQGTAAELREKYQSLRTEQVVYVLSGGNKKLYKLIVKGASLGSESKPKGSVPFYEYLNTFNGEDHVWQYKTRLTPTQEQNKAKKTYYAISFERGERLTDEEINAVVGPQMKELHTIFAASEQFYAAKAGKEEKESVRVHADEDPTEEEIPIINLDEEEEVPF